MQELIDRVTKATGLERQRAESAVGMTLFLIRKQGNRQKVDELFAKLPGAEKLAARHGDAAGRKGGILGALGGLVGGPLAAVAKLQAAGLTMDQIKTLGAEVLGYAKEKAGPEIVREATSSIPGLSGFA
jgi:hypothetical protein